MPFREKLEQKLEFFYKSDYLEIAELEISENFALEKFRLNQKKKSFIILKILGDYCVYKLDVFCEAISDRLAPHGAGLYFCINR